MLVKLDMIFAKALYSKSIKGSEPVFNTDGYIIIKEGRHPLINKDKVVPINIYLGKDFDLLIVTGPKTGGKTVSLKTVGLLTLMGQAGLHIPAYDGSSLSLFKEVYADIGDEQSIQDSLSTFSSHMINIIDILKESTSNSLILLDELGSGTEPVEGASLAISILEHFYNIGALTICTSHYPELKKYALTHEGFENASSDFDIENLCPTYKLLIGIPGKSNAFAISKKLGLSEDILNRAKTFLKEDDISIENLLKSIYDDKLSIEKEKEKIEKNSNQIEVLRKSLERDNSKLNKEAENILSDAKIKAREILLDAKDEVNDIIKELNNEKTDLKKANALRNKLNSSINEVSEVHTVAASSSHLSASDITIGQEVFFNKVTSTGIVYSLPNKSNEVRLQVGSIYMNAKLEDLSPVKASANKKSNSNISYSNNKAQSVASEINVIGLNVDEAIPIVDKYIDDCYMAHLEHARIVHGKGTGKLREGIHTFLTKHPHVKTLRLGTYGEGELGVTIVYFK